MKEDDLVANTILEKAADWTSPKPLLMALLQRLIQEMSLPFANQVIMSALKHDQGTFLKDYFKISHSKLVKNFSLFRIFEPRTL